MERERAMTHSNVSLRLAEGLDSKTLEPELMSVITQPVPRLIDGIPPYSFPAFAIALLCLVAAIGVQLVFRSLGASLLFATYYPAVVIAGMLAGVLAGVFVVFGSLLTVWWAFIPPAYEFAPVNFTQLVDLVLFMLCSACILVVVERYRAALTQIRIHCDGPDIEVSADTARYLVLVFHELVTNAAKYGALSNAKGRVLVSWKKAGGNINLEWREEGGPKISPPKRHNFGSRIVTQSLRSVLGSITPEFASDGPRCAITFRV